MGLFLFSRFVLRICNFLNLQHELSLSVHLYFKSVNSTIPKKHCRKYLQIRTDNIYKLSLSIICPFLVNKKVINLVDSKYLRIFQLKNGL